MHRDPTQLQEAATHAGAMATSIREAHSAACHDNDLLLEMVLLDLVGEAAALQTKMARVIYAASAEVKEAS